MDLKKVCKSPKCMFAGLAIGAVGTVLYYNFKMKKAKNKMRQEGVTEEQISSFCK